MSEVIIRTLWIYGLTIVVSLAVAVIIKAIVVTLNMLERKPAAPAQPVAVAPLVPLAVEADHIAAIAAAVYAMASTHRIVHIEATPHQSGWAAGGRQAHHASHSLHHHPKR